MTPPTGRFDGSGTGFAAGSGTGAGAPGADGSCFGKADADVGVDCIDCDDLDDNMRAEMDAPAAAEPAAIKASVVFDMMESKAVND